jgi:hypothetical protein
LHSSIECESNLHDEIGYDQKKLQQDHPLADGGGPVSAFFASVNEGLSRVDL